MNTKELEGLFFELEVRLEELRTLMPTNSKKELLIDEIIKIVRNDYQKIKNEENVKAI